MTEKQPDSFNAIDLLFILRQNPKAQILYVFGSWCWLVYRYFSERARATADKNLSIAMWTSGMNSPGNILAMTTRMQWAKSCQRQEKNMYISRA